MTEAAFGRFLFSASSLLSIYMNKLDIFTRGDGSHYGLSMWYSDCEDASDYAGMGWIGKDGRP